MNIRLASSAPSTLDRVMAGMAFLTKIDPSWRDKIDRKGLDIMYDDTCVMCHVFGSYNANVGSGRLIENHKKAADMGFYAYCHGTAGARAEYNALTKTWLDTLAAEDAVRTLMTSPMFGSRRMARTA